MVFSPGDGGGIVVANPPNGETVVGTIPPDIGSRTLVHVFPFHIHVSFRVDSFGPSPPNSTTSNSPFEFWLEFWLLF